MISVEEATQLVNSSHWNPVVESVLLDQCNGRVLAKDVLADRDFPPFDRVMMDGIAIRKSDFDEGIRDFNIKGLLAAGSPTVELETGPNCLEIMTGAVMAQNANVVIRYEDVELNDGVAKVIVDEVKANQNIHARGTDRKENNLIIPANTLLGAPEIGALATVGLASVSVYSKPRILIISTGDELVEVDESPLPYQIRKSNVHLLESMCRNLGLEPKRLHLDDQLDEIINSLRHEFCEADIVLLSGGVSKGKLDFLPEALEKLGVKKLFHKVKQRPGKPFWFGRKGTMTVFAFPGNPASTFMCATRYFIPWIRTSMKMATVKHYAILEEAFTFKPELQYFLQCKMSSRSDGSTYALPMPGKGSGDLANLVDSDCFLELPAERSKFEIGEVFPLWKF